MFIYFSVFIFLFLHIYLCLLLLLLLFFIIFFCFSLYIFVFKFSCRIYFNLCLFLLLFISVFFIVSKGHVINPHALICFSGCIVDFLFWQIDLVVFASSSFFDYLFAFLSENRMFICFYIYFGFACRIYFQIFLLFDYVLCSFIFVLFCRIVFWSVKFFFGNRVAFYTEF